MPIPVNTTPTLATNIGPLPTEVSQDVYDSPTTYTVWFKFTATADATVGAFAYNEGAGAYVPQITVYLGPDSSPVVYKGLSNIDLPIYFPVVDGTTYWIEVEADTEGTSADLRLSMLIHEIAAAPVGSIGINDDNRLFPLSLVDTAGDDVVLNYLTGPDADGFSSGEDGDVLPSGHVLISAAPVQGSGARLYDESFNRVATVLAGLGVTTITSNRVDLFYACTTESGSFKVYSIDTDGNVGATVYNLGSSSVARIAVSPGDTILYYTKVSNTQIVFRWDLVNNIALSDLVDTGASIDLPEILCLNDGTVITARVTGGDFVAKRWDDDGTLLNTYTVTPGAAGGRMARGVDDETTFWLWKKNVNPSIFKEVQVSDGTILTTLDVGLFNSGRLLGTVSDPLTVERFGSPDSCPFWLTRTLFPPDTPGGTGTIQVVKVTNPESDETEFDFVAAGGLTPTTFSLSTGETQTYNAVPAGDGYSVIETANVNYQTTVTVSNGSLPTNITVEEDETVVVTFTNSSVHTPGFNTRAVKRRWLRRSPIYSTANARVRWNMFQLDCQVGTGNTVEPGKDPQVYMSYSDDSGETWSFVMPMPMGKLGRYGTQLQWWRLGVGRSRVFQVYGSDPVKVALIDGFARVDPGTDGE